MEDWQHECCGEPFALGDAVTWPVVPVQDRHRLAAALGPEVTADVVAATPTGRSPTRRSCGGPSASSVGASTWTATAVVGYLVEVD
jgi:hypothetical protein